MCDTFVARGAATADGATIFGKNSDREPNEAQVLECHPRREHAAGLQRGAHRGHGDVGVHRSVICFCGEKHGRPFYQPDHRHSQRECQNNAVPACHRHVTFMHLAQRVREIVE